MTEYIQALQKLLLQLTTAEQQDVVEYYREYLQEADITTYEAAVAELGTPQTVARKVLADYSIKMTEQPASRQSAPAGTKANVKMIWLVVLALLSTPVTIPLILVVGALVVAAGSVVFAGVVTVLALLVAGFVGGIVGVIVGLMALLTAPWTGLFYLGLGLIGAGSRTAKLNGGVKHETLEYDQFSGHCSWANFSDFRRRPSRGQGPDLEQWGGSGRRTSADRGTSG